MKFIAVLLLILSALNTTAQDTKPDYIVAVSGMYNLENLFDTIDNPNVIDEEFLPSSAKKYNTNLYNNKLQNMAKVLADIGTSASIDGLAFCGVVEVENKQVLLDLCQQEILKSRNYQVVHYDSKDARGIDVALLYNPNYLTVLKSQAISVNEKVGFLTRDILYVKGVLFNDTIHILVNHWPSRRSKPGSFNSEDNGDENRVAAATVAKSVTDSINKDEKNARIILLGDFNDDPINKSIAEVINAKNKVDKITNNGFYNPYTDVLESGYGTLSYKGKWNLFDQQIFSGSFLDKTAKKLFLAKAHIYYKDYIVEQDGKYKGSPKRTWTGDIWKDGFSDHLPTYCLLVKQIN